MLSAAFVSTFSALGSAFSAFSALAEFQRSAGRFSSTLGDGARLVWSSLCMETQKVEQCCLLPAAVYLSQQ